MALAIISLPVPCMSAAIARMYSKAIRPRKIAGRCVLEAEHQGRLGRGEMIAAEVEFIGHVALAGVDVLAVEVSLAAAVHRAARGSGGSTWS